MSQLVRGAARAPVEVPAHVCEHDVTEALGSPGHIDERPDHRFGSSHTARPSHSAASDATTAREISVRDLRNHTADVIAAVRAGQRLELIVNRTRVAEIVAHRATANPCLPVTTLLGLLAETSADPALLDDLADIRGARIE
jgi:antitoxin (DNA-binding transcriptional repressor) of toxin-antitoxin stability system